MRRITVISAALLLVILSGYGADLKASMEELGLKPLKEGTESIDFELDGLNGKPVKLSSFKGKVVFLNFWATWCPPCRGEMPSMQKLYDRFKSEGLEIVAVDLQEDRNQVQSFMDSNNLSFTALLDRNGRVGATYGARSIPTTYIIDREGFVIAGAIGAREWANDAAFEFFEELLKNR